MCKLCMIALLQPSSRKWSKQQTGTEAMTLWSFLIVALLPLKFEKIMSAGGYIVPTKGCRLTWSSDCSYYSCQTVPHAAGYKPYNQGCHLGQDVVNSSQPQVAIATLSHSMRWLLMLT